MRKACSEQGRSDCRSVAAVPLNLNGRDEISPVLAGLAADLQPARAAR